MNIAIVYHSVTGTTAQLAEAVADGCSSVPATTAVLLRIEAADIEQGRYNNRAVLQAIDQADAVIFGSPTFMGSVSAQFKAFADATAGEYWGKQLWADKIAAGFTMERVDVSRLNFVRSGAALNAKRGVKFSYSK